MYTEEYKNTGDLYKAKTFRTIQKIKYLVVSRYLTFSVELTQVILH